ncbi:hypothetical protein ISS37_01965 [candidate division KSB1 bacterium]|nr:hypothetical protein [candidate division KSB1 bacterium]
MSCYTRHLDDLFAEAGVERTRENRKKFDQFLKASGQFGDDCSHVWRKVKEHRANPEERKKLVEMIKTVVSGS